MRAPKQIDRRALLSSLLTTSGAFIASGCLGPTLPLPPPDPPDHIGLASGETDVWELRGHCSRGAVVLVENLATGIISGVVDTDSTGSYLVRIEASQRDDAAVWELLGDSVSDHAFFIVQETISGVPTSDGCT